MPTPPAPVEPNKTVVVIDGDVLEFERSITWECMPQNIEVFLHDSYFAELETFSRRVTPEVQRELLLKDAVEKIWGEFDVNNNGSLDQVETKAFLKKALKDIPPPNEYDESKFDVTFRSIDKNRNGVIERAEMVIFLKSVLKKEEEAEE